MAAIKYKRILVKLSGEALMGKQGSGIDPQMILQLAGELAAVHEAGVEIGIVVGGGNLFRGAGLAAAGLDRVTGDHMGMLATVMNALALQDGLLSAGKTAVVMSGLAMPHRKPLFYHRHRRQPACNRDMRRSADQGNQGRWDLRQGPDKA
jgi:uridylate kinase